MKNSEHAEIFEGILYSPRFRGEKIFSSITMLSRIEDHSLKFRVATRTAAYQAHQPRLNRP